MFQLTTSVRFARSTLIERKKTSSMVTYMYNNPEHRGDPAAAGLSNTQSRSDFLTDVKSEHILDACKCHLGAIFREHSSSSSSEQAAPHPGLQREANAPRVGCARETTNIWPGNGMGHCIVIKPLIEFNVGYICLQHIFVCERQMMAVP